MFCAFRANEPYEPSGHGATLKHLKNKRAPENNWGLNGEQRMQPGKNNMHPKWVVWSFWGTVLLFLSDPDTHFSLSVFE